MIKTIKKENSKWILLFLFTFFCVGVQGQQPELGGYSGSWLEEVYNNGGWLLDEVVIVNNYVAPKPQPYVAPVYTPTNWTTNTNYYYGGGGSYSSGGYYNTNKAQGPGIPGYNGRILTRTEFNLYKENTKDSYHISQKENMIIKTSNGTLHQGTLTKFESYIKMSDGKPHVFYYFTPNQRTSVFAYDLYCYIPDNLGNQATAARPENASFTPDQNNSFIYDNNGFPSGYGYVRYNYFEPIGMTLMPGGGSFTILNTVKPTVPYTLATSCPSDEFDLVDGNCVYVYAAPDPNPSKAGGATRADAKVLHKSILEVLDKNPKFDKFKALLQRGPDNNQKFFSKIPADKLDLALEDFDYDSDEAVFAYIIANTINSDKPMTIKYFSGSEVVIDENRDVKEEVVKTAFWDPLPADYKTYFLSLNVPDSDPPVKKTVTTKDILQIFGGGSTAKYGEGIYAIVSTAVSTKITITSLHEFFGHGYPLSIETSAKIHNQDDAVLFENLVWRLLGEPDKQKNGDEHYEKKIIPNHTTTLPSFR